MNGKTGSGILEPLEPRLLLAAVEGQLWHVSAAIDEAGRLVAAWTDRDRDGSEEGTLARTFPGFHDDAVYHPVLYSGVVTGLDFAVHLPVSISGQAFEDQDVDGLQGTGEPGLSGRTIELVDAGSGQVVAAGVTEDRDLDVNGTIDPVTEAGLYSFDGLVPGSYELREVLPDDWIHTTDPDVHSLDVQSGDELSDVNFGSARVGSIGGAVFHDVDAGGSRGADEPGLDGWVVELVDADTGAVLASQTTAGVDLDDDGQIDSVLESGRFLFEDLLPGSYQIRQVLQTGWAQILPAGAAYSIPLGYDQDVAGVDFGNWLLRSTIRGQKFEDLDGDAVAGHVQHVHGDRVFVQRHDVQDVAAQFVTRPEMPGKSHAQVFGQCVREQIPLHSLIGRYESLVPCGELPLVSVRRNGPSRPVASVISNCTVAARRRRGSCRPAPSRGPSRPRRVMRSAPRRRSGLYGRHP